MGRKRSIVTDARGLLLAVLVTAASVQDSRWMPVCSTNKIPHKACWSGTKAG
ncbi:hypothetical protein GCM10011579_088190 [Streptomyces albiflavescens]|uniref:Transposase n=1 Tax=Streptomyces albiflavescens TaxID=1623582 RepID=A0A918DAP9_9ACTN|nr:hypothetical protein GCM10011579_088190 [Streptomyces albiflavescens]